MNRLTRVPWSKPRREALLLGLVAVTALSLVYNADSQSQDTSRLCLSRAIVHGRLYDDGCFGLDRATYKGHTYSDKAPGLSFLELPAAEALRLPEQLHADARLWLLRVMVVGTLFVSGAFLIGRVSEGLAPGFGGIALVSFALGTLTALFGAANFDEVPSAVLGFGAFLLAWRRKPFLAGLVAGAAVVVEYQLGIVALAVAGYVALAGWRPLVRYFAGIVPSALLLGLYDWLAFGAPWRLSYRYVSNEFTAAQGTGLFGIGVPTPHGFYDVFSGDGGLISASPVLVAAAWGLVLVGRRYPAEAILCAAITVAFVIVDTGYFLPYGDSPGPRFLIPALPFLCVGLAPAFARFPGGTTALAAASVLTMTAKMLDWGQLIPQNTVWGEVARIPAQRGSSDYVQHLEQTAFDWVLPGRVWGAVVVALFALAALITGIRSSRWRGRRRVRDGQGLQRSAVLAPATAAIALSVCAIASAGTLAVFDYPYGTIVHNLSVAVTGSATTATQGQEVDFQLTISDASLYEGYPDVTLTIDLTPGMQLRGPPYYERGSGCHGTSTITCDLGDLSPRMSTPVRLAVLIASPRREETLAANVTSGSSTSAHPATFAVQVG